jgi:hypothetical protein
MNRIHLLSTLFLAILLGCASVFSQTKSEQYQSQEVSEADGVPVLIKNLPDWESVRDHAKITNRIEEVREVFGSPAVLSGIDLDGGAEAAYASYGESRLVLIEYPTPQASTEADAAIQSRLAETPGAVYKRVGNYNALVFGATDPSDAEALLGKLHYGKTVQWLGEDPYFMQKFERYIAMTGRDMVISTVLFITGVLASAAMLGVLAGFFYFRFRQQQQAKWHTFSDAGGLTRLNLDELSD